ncbi:MAG: sigma-70 family RNA polymerase sigma factor [Bacteroidota bacterium]
MNSPDKEILAGLQSGYKQRLMHEKRLYSDYSYFIGEGCKKFHLSNDDSFSAYSDAVLSVIHNVSANRFDGRSSLKTYLFQIFSNKCIDLVRKNTTNKQQVHQTMPMPELLNQLPDQARTVIEQLMDQQKQAAIQTNLDAIGQKCRALLLLFEDGLTDREIADELEYNSAAVVKTTRLRCLEKLREKVQSLFL